MRRNSAEIVAMRKLASSKIFNVEFYFTGGSRKREHIHENISLSDLNKYMKEYFENTLDHPLKEIALGGHIKTSPAHRYELRKETKKFFVVSNINSAGIFDIGGSEVVYIKIWSEKLSSEDLETILGLGLELNRWDKHIEKTRNPIA